MSLTALICTFLFLAAASGGRGGEKETRVGSAQVRLGRHLSLSPFVSDFACAEQAHSSPSHIVQTMADAPAVKVTLPDEQVQEASETQPLLSHHESGLEDPPRKRSLWEIGLYFTLSVIGAVLLGFFIKGFIDADDVDVGGSQNLFVDAYCVT